MESKGIDTKEWNSNNLNSVQKQKLNKFFGNIADKASIDYTNPEFLDIHTAVEKYLQIAVSKINRRDIFRVARIQPCGSMAEKNIHLEMGKI